MLAQPSQAKAHVVTPAVPVCLRKLAGAVAGAGQVQYQGTHANGRKRMCLHRHHGTAAVHFFRECGHHQHIADGHHVNRGRVVVADQVAVFAAHHDGAQVCRSDGVIHMHGLGGASCPSADGRPFVTVRWGNRPGLAI